MSVLSCQNISLAYGTDVILDGITFSINQGARLGIIGVNGAGKSTLMRIITGKISADSGCVSVAQGLKLASLEQYTDSSFGGKTVTDVVLSHFSELTEMEHRLKLLENDLHTGNDQTVHQYTTLRDRFELLGGYEYKAKAISTVKKLGFTDEDLKKEADKLSGGQKTRLSLASLLLSSPDIILLDEPTNHLDIKSTVWLEEQIRNSSATFIIISHDRYFLDRTTTETLEIENCRGTIYKGAYTEFKEKKKKLLEDSAKHYDLQQKEIARLEAFIQNQRKWNRERNIIAAESRMKAIARMKKLDKPENAPTSIRICINTDIKSSYDVLSVRNISKSFADQKLFSNLSFELKKNDKLFIIGGNGTGKSTLLKIINGVLSADSGNVELGYNQNPGYYDQEQMLLDNSLNVITELWNAYPDMTQTELRKTLAQYGFRGDDVFKCIADLSGGEKARLAIAKLVLSGCTLLVLDEPTNYLDIQSKEVLENALKDYKGTLLCVSHDRYFISSLATRLLDIDRQYTDGYNIYNCSYNDYLKQKPITENVKTTTRKQSEGAVDFNARKKEKNDKRKEEKRKAFLEEAVKNAEARVAEIDCLISKNATDYIMLQQLQDEKDELDNKILEYLDELLTIIDS